MSLPGAVLFLLIGSAFGLGMIGIALGWIPYDRAQIHVSTGILVLVGLVFIAGATMPLASQPGVSRHVGNLITAAVMLGVAVVCLTLEFSLPEHPGAVGSTVAGPPPPSRAAFQVRLQGAPLSNSVNRILLVVAVAAFVSFAVYATRSWLRRPRGEAAGRDTRLRVESGGS
jgi:hypothetical protein